jgi:hypothetical protein
MTSTVFRNIFRFIGFVLIQALVLQRIILGEGWLDYPPVFLYPLFIVLLPLRTPHALLVLIGFVCGISVDLFYSSYGLHAAASAFTAYLRPTVLRFLEPRGGYNINHSPTKYRYGAAWFLQYCSILMVLHLFFFFSVDAFTFVFLGKIALRTVTSFAISMLFIILYIYSFNPKE